MGGGVSRLPFSDRRNPHPPHGAPSVPTAPQGGARAPPSPRGSRGLKISVMAHHFQGNCALSPRRTQGPWPSLHKAIASLDKARHHPCPRGRKRCIVISERTWASFAGSAGPTPVSTADSSPSGWVVGEERAGRRPTRLTGDPPRVPILLAEGSWREALEAHRRHSHLGWGMWEREWLASEAPARSWPLFLVTFPCLGSIL